MRAFHLGSPGGTLVPVDRPPPSPSAGCVVVDLKAATLNYRDILVRDGRYGGAQRPGLIPVSDGAGVISAVGAGVPTTRIGERVTIGFMPDWVEGPFSAAKQATSLGANATDGVLAEQIVVPASSVTVIPPSWSFEEAAAYPCAGVTAWTSLFGGRGILPGQTVLVQGSGGVSTFALQFAVRAGARVIATSSSDEKLDWLRSLGAHEGINYRTTPEWGRRAADIAGGGGVDHVVDIGGPETLNQALQAARPGAEIALVGVLTGFSGSIDTGAILFKAITVRGVFVGSVADLAAAMASGVRPIVEDVFAFDDAEAAYARLASGAHRGKIAIRIGG